MTSAFNHLFHRLFQYHGNDVKRTLGLVNSLVTVPQTHAEYPTYRKHHAIWNNTGVFNRLSKSTQWNKGLLLNLCPLEALWKGKHLLFIHMAVCLMSTIKKSWNTFWPWQIHFDHGNREVHAQGHLSRILFATSFLCLFWIFFGALHETSLGGGDYSYCAPHTVSVGDPFKSCIIIVMLIMNALNLTKNVPL